MNKIGYSERKAVYETAIDKYGSEVLLWMVIKEVNEIAEELHEIMCGRLEMEAIADKIANMTIMLEQARLMFDVNDLVCEHMDAKIERLRQRIGIDV